MKTIYLLLVFMLIGCGTRKVEKQTSIEDKSLDIKQTSELKIDADVRKDVIQYTNEEELVIEPLDLDKPIEMTGPDGKTTSIKNGKITKRSKQQATNTSEKSNIKIAAKQKSETKAKSKAKLKVNNTERKPDFSFLWLIIIAAILYVSYRIKRGLK